MGAFDDQTLYAQRPKIISFAMCWTALFAIVLVVYGIVPYPYSSQPWTRSAINFLLAAELLYFCWMISRRNLAGVLSVALPFFLTVCWLVSFAAGVGLAAIPLAALALPQCVRWLKADSRFSTVRVVVMIILAGLGYTFYTTPSLTANDISNMNPIAVFSLGGKPHHQLNEAGQHVYAWWRCDSNVGTCCVQYDEDCVCCSMTIDMRAWGTGLSEYYDAFVSEVKEECERCYGDEIKWSETVTDDGRVMVLGRLRDELSVKITPGADAGVLGSALIYSPRLCHEPSSREQKEEKALATRLARIMNEAYESVDRGDSPAKVAKNFCERMRAIRPECLTDEAAAETFFRTRSVYGAKYNQVSYGFCDVWRLNIKSLLDKTSDDFIYRGSTGSRARLSMIKQALDEWAYELEAYSKRLEGAGRILSAGENESAFAGFMEGLANSKRSHQEVMDVFARQYEILLLFANNGRENPNLSALIEEFAANQDKIKAMAGGMQARLSGGKQEGKDDAL